MATKKRQTVHEFFGNHKHFVAPPEFNDCILSKVQPDKAVEAVAMRTKYLLSYMNDREILEELSERKFFSEEEVAATIAAHLSKQKNGEKGVLQINGYANIFYTHSHVVDVHWDIDRRLWLIEIWAHGERRWRTDHCVFYPLKAA